MSLPPHFGMEQKGRDIMRMFKTPKDQRTNYIYRHLNGGKIILTPDDVDTHGEENADKIITILHGYDDEEVDANRREDYYAKIHFKGEDDWLQRSSNSAVNKATADLPRIADSCNECREYMADPLDLILNAVEEQEHSKLLGRLQAALASLTDLQKTTIYKKYYQNMTNVAIAAEEGVSEAAIRNRLKKIFANLAKKI